MATQASAICTSCVPALHMHRESSTGELLKPSERTPSKPALAIIGATRHRTTATLGLLGRRGSQVRVVHQVAHLGNCLGKLSKLVLGTEAVSVANTFWAEFVAI